MSDFLQPKTILISVLSLTWWIYSNDPTASFYFPETSFLNLLNLDDKFGFTQVYCIKIPCNFFFFLCWKLQGLLTCLQWQHQKFFCGGGIEGAKCDSEGAKIQKFAENGWFWPFFLLTGGQVGGRASDWGTFAPHAPPPWCCHCLFAIQIIWNKFWMQNSQNWTLV